MNIDFDRLRLLLQPFALRISGLLQSILKAAYSAVAGIKSLHDASVNDVSRRLSYDSSVKNIRQAIADATGCAYSDVVISDSEDRDALILYEDSMLNPVMIGNTTPVTLYSDDMLYYTNDFDVYVPMQYTYLRAVISSVIDKYKRAGTHYNLNFN